MKYRIVQVEPGDGGSPFYDIVETDDELEALTDGGGRTLMEAPLDLVEPLEELVTGIRLVQQAGGDIITGHSIDDLLIRLFEIGRESVSG